MMTIGHSTLEIEDFLRALRENGCETLVDVRRFPGSRRYPQFGQASLFASLAEVGIRGVWREGLGGRRPARKDSANLGWKNSSFRGYADYMQSPEFTREIDWLMALPELSSTVVMCAEAVPWRCHRSLIADAVIARGGTVEDIFVAANGTSSRKVHEMTKFAHVGGGRVWYPKESREGELFGVGTTSGVEVASGFERRDWGARHRAVRSPVGVGWLIWQTARIAAATTAPAFVRCGGRNRPLQLRVSDRRDQPIKVRAC